MKSTLEDAVKEHIIKTKELIQKHEEDSEYLDTAFLILVIDVVALTIMHISYIAYTIY